ncbi:cell wall-binding protein [Bacillus toyonensis]|uniref:cell wall-binding protein n=1 Tax=Bacillus toyonensis TaxID=155322 RepID=UPI0011557530|nr:cell wall-binding protein [Bacillus toyonensis]
MIKKSKKGMRKILPVGLAMGVLFSGIPLATPLTEHKVKADVDTAATIITTFGKIYDSFLAEPFGKWLDELGAKNGYNSDLENSGYKAPTFEKGEFGITAFDYYKNKDFSKTVKLSYPNGKAEYKTIKHGQQIRIKQAGTIVDLTPDEPELSKHDILYITQKQLNEGNTGVSLTNFKTYYLQSDNSGRRNALGEKFLKQVFPNAYLSSGLIDVRYSEDELFKELPEDKRVLATITSKPVGKEVLSNYATNDPEAREDLKKRTFDIYTDHNARISTKIINDGLNLEAGDYVHEEGNWDPSAGTDFTITPIRKGSDKVVISSVFNGEVRFLTSKSGDHSQWIYTHSGDISADEVWDLVIRENNQFSLKNNKGQYLYVPRNGRSAPAWTTDDINTASKLTARLAAHEWNNWLIDWHPRKENEPKKHEGKTYDGLEFKSDEKDSSIWTAYNSGELITNSWIKRSDDHYYAGSDGVLLKGWQEIEGNTYYFNPGDNHRVSVSGLLIDGKYYNFNDDGVLLKSAWKGDKANGLFYSDASGAIIKEGLKEMDGKIYYFKNYKATTNELRLEDQDIVLHFSDKGVLEKASKLNGEALNSIRTGVILDEKQLAFEKDGSIRKNGVSKIFLPPLGGDEKEQPALVYYSLEEGSRYTGWKEIGGKKYYFEDGINYIFDDNHTIDGKKYYFNSEGEVLPTGFINADNKTYYYNDKGEMQTGVQKINGETYYFSKKTENLGQIQCNIFFNYEGKNYYAGNNGAALRNKDGYVWDDRTQFEYYVYINNEGHIVNSWRRN